MDTFLNELSQQSATWIRCYCSWKSRPTSRGTFINHLNGLLENILWVKVHGSIDGMNFRSRPYNIRLEVVPTSVLVHYSCSGFLPPSVIHFFAFNINQERFNRTSVTLLVITFPLRRSASFSINLYEYYPTYVVHHPLPIISTTTVH